MTDTKRKNWSSAIQMRIEMIVRETKKRRLLAKARKLRSRTKVNISASKLIMEDRNER